MSDKPHTFMPLVLGDFLKHVGRIDRADIGSYLLILMDYWVNGAPPDDDAILARIARCTPAEWKKTRRQLARFFTIEGGVWTQKRAEEEFASAVVRQDRAKKAAGARWKAEKRTGKRHDKDAPSIAPSNAVGIDQASFEHGSKHMLERCPPSPSPPEGNNAPAGLVIPLQGASVDSLPGDDPRRAQASMMSEDEKAQMRDAIRDLAAQLGGGVKRMPT